MSTAAPFAFLVHPRARIGEDLARVWRPLGRVPEGWIDSAVRRLPLPSYAMARVHLDSAPVGHVVLVPFGAKHLLSEPHEGRARVGRAIDHAVRLALESDLRGFEAIIVASPDTVLERPSAERVDVGADARRAGAVREGQDGPAVLEPGGEQEETVDPADPPGGLPAADPAVGRVHPPPAVSDDPAFLDDRPEQGLAARRLHGVAGEARNGPDHAGTLPVLHAAGQLSPVTGGISRGSRRPFESHVDHRSP